MVPASPGFKTVRIQPAPGTLTHLESTMPHPLGDITVSLIRRDKTGITGTATLPPGLAGTFVWNGKTTPLRAGTNAIGLR